MSHTGKEGPLPEDSPEKALDFRELLSVQDPSKLPKMINFDDLARCGEEIWIVNRGDLYRLRRTKQGKLILTK